MVALRKWLFSIYASLRFNTSFRQLQREIDVTYKTIHRRVERSGKARDAPRLEFVSLVEIDEVYVSAGLKGHESDSYAHDKPPIFTTVGRGTGQRYAGPAASADESTVCLLLADHEVESLTVYIEESRPYYPLEDDDEFDCEYGVHGDGEYANEEVRVNT